MEQLIAEYWGQILAVGILAAFLASLIPHIIRSRREDRELERVARCGPGCICTGENLRARQQQITAQALQSQAAAPLIIQHPAPQSIHYPQTQPQIILLQTPQPQVIYPPAPQTPLYLPAPTPTYQPTPQAQRPVSYYSGPATHLEDYPREVYYLLAQQPVGQLPPARASAIDEARRAFEREREVERQSRR